MLCFATGSDPNIFNSRSLPKCRLVLHWKVMKLFKVMIVVKLQINMFEWINDGLTEGERFLRHYWVQVDCVDACIMWVRWSFFPFSFFSFNKTESKLKGHFVWAKMHHLACFGGASCFISIASYWGSSPSVFLLREQAFSTSNPSWARPCETAR